MPRTASDYTEAIRSLLDETKGAITHGDARPRLENLGFDLAAKPKHKSSELSMLDEYNYDEKAVSVAIRENDMDTVRTVLEPVFTTLKYDEATQKAVIDEMRVRLAFFDERNFFDVTKFNWSQIVRSSKPSESRKPTGTKNQRAVRNMTKDSPKPKHKRRGRPRKETETPTVNTKRRGRPRKETVIQPSSNELVALELIEKLGGVGNASKRVAELQREAAELENAIELLAQLAKRSDELQKRIRSAA